MPKTLLLAAVIGFPSIVAIIDALVGDHGPQPAVVEAVADSLRGEVGVALADSVAVHVVDRRGHDAVGVTVRWVSKRGQVTPATSITDALGVARTSWTLDGTAGAQHLDVTVSGARDSSIVITALAVPGQPSRLRRVELRISDDGTADTAVVRVVDAFGNGVPGVAVGWRVVAGGSVEPTRPDTDAEGVSVAAWIPSASVLSDTLAVAVRGLTGSPIMFTREGGVTSWVELSGASPGPMSGHAGVNGPQQSIVVFGGRAASGLTNTLRRLTRGSWTVVPPGNPIPSARAAHAMAYDEISRRVVVFGGIGTSGALNDTWLWDGSVWLTETVGTAPPARSGHAMVFHRPSNSVVLFGGVDGTGAVLNDTWVWDGTKWERKAVRGPGARSRHAMVFDPARREVLLFGGSRGTEGGDSVDNFWNDTWVWDGEQWNERQGPMAPASRGGAAMAFDPSRELAVLFGGSRGTPLADTWEWDGQRWAPGNPAQSPPGRAGGLLVYDQQLRRLVLFGGVGATLLGDTWEFRAQN